MDNEIWDNEEMGYFLSSDKVSAWSVILYLLLRQYSLQVQEEKHKT